MNCFYWKNLVKLFILKRMMSQK